MCAGKMPTLQIKQYSETRSQEYKPLSSKVFLEKWCKPRLLHVSYNTAEKATCLKVAGKIKDHVQ